MLIQDSIDDSIFVGVEGKLFNVEKKRKVEGYKIKEKQEIYILKDKLFIYDYNKGIFYYLEETNQKIISKNVVNLTLHNGIFYFLKKEPDEEIDFVQYNPEETEKNSIFETKHSIEVLISENYIILKTNDSSIYYIINAKIIETNIKLENYDSLFSNWKNSSRLSFTFNRPMLFEFDSEESVKE